MITNETNQDSLADDEAYEKAPLQFTANKMAELVRRAEEDPSRAVIVPAHIMHKLYVAYLGVLEVYTEHTAAGTLINGERFLCSAGLSNAIAPIMDEHRRIQAEKDIDREIELMKTQAAATHVDSRPESPQDTNDSTAGSVSKLH